MRPSLSCTRTCRRPALVLALALVSGSGGCSGTTEPPPTWATLTLVSGDKQTVTMGPEVLTNFPQPVVVHLDSFGTPIAEGWLRVTVFMNGAPGPNGPYAFTTDANGNESMQLVISKSCELAIGDPSLFSLIRILDARTGAQYARKAVTAFALWRALALRQPGILRDGLFSLEDWMRFARVQNDRLADPLIVYFLRPRQVPQPRVVIFVESSAPNVLFHTSNIRIGLPHAQSLLS